MWYWVDGLSICRIVYVVLLICIYSKRWSQCASVKNINTSWEDLVDVCPPNYSYFEMSCYKLNSTIVPRSEASATCRKENAHLVDITSPEEQKFVADILENNQDIQRLREIKNEVDVGAWIGLMASGISRNLVWTDGRFLEYAAWDSRYGRNELGVNCVRMDSRFHFQWGDRNCRDHFSFVCERNTGFVASSPSAASPHVSTERDHSATTVSSDINNTDSISHNNYRSELTAIEISYPILTVVVVVAVGVSVYCCYLRNKMANQRHDSNPGTQQTTSVKSQEEAATDVRISYQSNNYLAFKSDSQQNHVTNLSSAMHNHVISHDTSCDQNFKREGEIKHTYFDPMEARKTKMAENHVYTYIDTNGKDKVNRASDPKYAAVI